MDFDSIRTLCDELRKVSKIKNSPITIGFTCSSFDLLHAGHYLMLEDCKKHCDVLIVGLQDDPTLDKNYRIKTGGKNKNEERLIQVSGVKYVDYVVKYSTEDELYKLLQKINPDVRMIGEDWRNKEFTGHDLEIPIHFNPRSHSYSTSSLRARVFEAEYTKRM